jgi:hypothetical protein
MDYSHFIMFKMQWRLYAFYQYICSRFEKAAQSY